MGGEHLSEAFRAKSPDVVAPCLELANATYNLQCNTITKYIGGHFEGPSLTGGTRKERSQVSMMNLLAESGLLNAIAACFHHAKPGLGQDLEKYQRAEWDNK